MRCFYCENLEEEYAVLDKIESNHLFRVLRAAIGTKILLNDGKGTLAEAELEENKKIRLINRIIFKLPDIRVHLFVAVPRKNKMDIILSQCTEAGVWCIYPMITDRNVAVPNKEDMRLKWKLKLIEACKQSKNPFLPDIYNPVSLNKAVYIASDKKFTAFFGDVPENVKLANKPLLNVNGDIAWFVGPEGGFTEEELNLMNSNGFTGLSTGPYIMRIETAALAGIVLLQN